MFVIMSFPDNVAYLTPILTIRDDERGLVIRARVSEYALWFESREINSWSTDYSVVYLTKAGADSSMDITEDFDTAERYVDGSVKWDGCSNIEFGDEAGSIHFCGQRDFQKLVWFMQAVFAMAADKIPKFDHSVAGLPLLR